MIAVLVPTRGRVPLLHQMLTSLFETASGAVEVIARVDEDDVLTRNYLQDRGDVVVLVGPHWDGYASLARMVNECAARATAPLMIVVNDDVVFRTPGWDRTLAARAAHYPDGIVSLGVDTVMNNENFVFPCVTRRVVQALGCFYDERLIYTDIWLRDVLAHFGRAIRAHDVVIEHCWRGMTPDQERALQTVQSPAYAPLYGQCVREGIAKVQGVLRERPTVNVCVPVLKRYDLLRDLLRSLHTSTIQPTQVVVIDNGRDLMRLRRVLGDAELVDARYTRILSHTPPAPMGVAESWNWFIEHTDEERVIVNDDITFAPDSLERLLASRADLVWAEGCGFSCFVLRDACVKKIGLFDETISPGYGYYEDEDYLQRLDGRGTRAPSAVAENVACGVRHEHSATLKAASHAESLEHHRRFKIAQANYIKKWHLEKTFA